MVKLYHTNCPQCKMVELQLNKHNIPYEEIEGEEGIVKLGFKSSPVLDVDGKYYVGGKECLNYIHSLGE